MDSISEYYNLIFHKYEDAKIISYPLMGTPIWGLAIVAFYCLFTKRIGPALMKNRPAFEIKPIIQAYNLFQILTCGYLAIASIRLFFEESNWHCLEHYGNSQHELNIIKLCWIYIMLKYVDLLDTVFFILRKKFNLITTLHFYHHTMVALAVTILARIWPAGEGLLVGAINSFVHCLMYSYYFYCMQNSKKGSIWWKKHITQVQLIQFYILITFYGYKFVFVHDCSYPKTLIFFHITQMATMIYMFQNYYYNAFIKSKKSKQMEYINSNYKTN